MERAIKKEFYATKVVSICSIISYNFRKLYVITMITKKISIECTQKGMKKKSKCFITKT